MIGEDYKEPESEGKKKMPKTAEKPVKEVVREEGPVPVSGISPRKVLDNVLRILGKPHNLCQISPNLTRAAAVTANNFRVNIYTAEDRGYFTSNILSHTYFVKVGDDGRILTSTPEIIKHYE